MSRGLLGKILNPVSELVSGLLGIGVQGPPSGAFQSPQVINMEPPRIEDAAGAAQEKADAARRRKGHRANILSPSKRGGKENAATLGSDTILGGE